VNTRQVEIQENQSRVCGDLLGAAPSPEEVGNSLVPIFDMMDRIDDPSFSKNVECEGDIIWIVFNQNDFDVIRIPCSHGFF
jgi:hypothetical protein